MIRFGVHTGPQECAVAELVELWSVAERLGFEWISIWDHFYPAQVAPDEDCLEAVACHALLAAKTKTVRVGSLVYCVGYRHPAVLANVGATIDHISGGRLELGLGAGWHEAESAAYGLALGPPSVRFRRLAEAVEVVRLLWSEPTADFHGEFFTLNGARCHPKPVQEAPRIWIGARGERLGLPLAGRLGDGWNTAYVGPEDFARMASIVKEHAPSPDRLVTGVNVGLVLSEADPDEALRRRYGASAEAVKDGTLLGSVAEIVEKVGRYADGGADWLILGLRAPFDLVALERFASEVLPHFSDRLDTTAPAAGNDVEPRPAPAPTRHGPIRLRRIVTGEDTAGRSVVAHDDAGTNRIEPASYPGLVVDEIWSTAETPAALSTADRAVRGHDVEPARQGSVFRVIQIPPDHGLAVDAEATRAEFGLTDNVPADGHQRHHSMHRTSTLDYLVVLSGELWMLLDDGEVLLKPGTCVVQQATLHGFSNRSDAPCVLAAVLVDADA